MEKSRGKSKYRTDLTNRKQYTKYTKEYSNPIDKITWNNLWSDFWNGYKEECTNKDIRGVFDMIIFDNLEYFLPYKMGSLSIVKKKIPLRLKEDGTLDTKWLVIDWDSTIHLWKENSNAKEKRTLIYYTNTHTGGYRMSWKWRKRGRNCIFRNKTYYKLDINRTTDRNLSSILKNPDYNLDFYLK
jgi:hypothetical protein